MWWARNIRWCKEDKRGSTYFELAADFEASTGQTLRATWSGAKDTVTALDKMSTFGAMLKRASYILSTTVIPTTATTNVVQAMGLQRRVQGSCYTACFICPTAVHNQLLKYQAVRGMSPSWNWEVLPPGATCGPVMPQDEAPGNAHIQKLIPEMTWGNRIRVKARVLPSFRTESVDKMREQAILRAGPRGHSIVLPESETLLVPCFRGKETAFTTFFRAIEVRCSVCGRTRAVGRLGTILKEPCPGAAMDDHQGRRPPVAKEDNANKKKEVSKGTKREADTIRSTGAKRARPFSGIGNAGGASSGSGALPAPWPCPRGGTPAQGSEVVTASASRQNPNKRSKHTAVNVVPSKRRKR
jgi:hypothetical protein